jgi:hypothetical protein
MEEVSKSPDAEHTTPARDTVPNRTDEDEALPATLYLGHSVQFRSGSEASPSLPEDIGYRSFSQSHTANRQSPWRLVSSASSATSSSSLDIIPPCEGVISDDSGFVILTEAEGGEGKNRPINPIFLSFWPFSGTCLNQDSHFSSSSFTSRVFCAGGSEPASKAVCQPAPVITLPPEYSPPTDRSCSESSHPLFLHPARCTGPSPVSEMSQAVTPAQGEVEPEVLLSLDPDLNLNPLQLLHSQPIDIPAGSKHHLEIPNTLETAADCYCLSDCDSAILEPRSPPQESGLVTCPYCLITAANGGE